MKRAVTMLWTLMLGCVGAVPSGLRAQGYGGKPRVIVFVHGLHGDKETWRAPNGAYWPQLVATDPQFAKSDVVVAEYPTPSSHGTLSTVQLAEILWKNLAQKGVWQHRDIVFVTHSLGGLITEEMLLKHPADAVHVPFIVSYATPHSGSFVANLAKIYDGDPLLTDLSSSNDNSFLIDLEQQWRGTPGANRIHRFCAYETQDTAAGEGVGRYLHARIRVVDPYSATYGCDIDTAAQKIVADHISIVKPASRSADAYTFFATIYRRNPIIDVVQNVRDNKISGLMVDCNKTNTGTDLQVPIPLDPTLHEQVLYADAEFVDRDKVLDVTAPKVVKIDPNGIAHVSYAFKGQGRGVMLGCPVGRVGVMVHFTVQGQVPE